MFSCIETIEKIETTALESLSESGSDGQNHAILYFFRNRTNLDMEKINNLIPTRTKT